MTRYSQRPPDATATIMKRHIVHLEIPDFYAALEQLRDPCRGRGPLAVAEPAARSLVCSVNRAARREGIREGMFLGQARRLCRRLRVVAPDFPFYRRRHRELVIALGRFSPLVEGTSPGRYFVDLTGTRRLWGPVPDTACRLERELLDRCRLRARIGLAVNKLVSRVAARCVVPGDLGWVFAGGERAFLRPLPVKLLPGVGIKTASVLEELGLVSVGQLADLDPQSLMAVFGKTAGRLVNLARGRDELPVVPFQDAPRLALVQTLERAEIDRSRLESFLWLQMEEAGWVLRRHNRYPEMMAMEIRYADGVGSRGEDRLEADEQHLDRCLFQRARKLFRRIFRRRVAVGRIRVEFQRFSMPFRQLSLIPGDGERRLQEKRLQQALDRVRLRFGRDSVFWASSRPGADVAEKVPEASGADPGGRLEWEFH